jgi:uncharacterized membrane protein
MALTGSTPPSGPPGTQARQAPPSPTTTLSGSARWSVCYGLGMLLLFIGERIIAAGAARLVASAAGLLLLFAAIVARAVRSGRTAPDRQAVERSIQTMYVVGLVAVIAYFVQSDLPTLRGGTSLDTRFPKLAVALAALWPVVWCVAAFAILPMELAYAPMQRAPRIETGRVRAAQYAGMGTAFILTLAFSLAYAASERDHKWDLAYFRTTRPGESTRKIVRSLDAPVTVAVFFPNGNEVREEVDAYLSDLARESSQLKVEHYDFDIDPAKAKELGVSGNGVLVFARGGRKEQLGVSLQMESARANLKVLDREVQQRLLSAVKPNRVTMLTVGHGERTADPVDDNDRRPGIRELRNALLDQGHDVRELGPAQGLATDIPKDVTLVMILGPTRAFAPEEIAALQRFLARGGRVFMAVDPDAPEAGASLNTLLEPIGLKLGMKTLVNDQIYASRTHQDADRANLVTALFSSHPSVTTLSRQGMRAPVVLPGAGAIIGPRPHAPALNGWSVDYAVHAHAATFSDDNGNFRFDPGDERKAWELAAVASRKVDKSDKSDKAATPTAKDPKGKPTTVADPTSEPAEGRLFVVGDSDFLTDPVIRFAGNGFLVLDPVRWLMGEESFAGQVSSEVDVPISHTRKQDVVWFYSTIFLVPALVLGLGFLVTRRKRRGRPEHLTTGPSLATTSARGTTP